MLSIILILIIINIMIIVITLGILYIIFHSVIVCPGFLGRPGTRWLLSFTHDAYTESPIQALMHHLMTLFYGLILPIVYGKHK